jgi:hypothetical protein
MLYQLLRILRGVDKEKAKKDFGTLQKQRERKKDGR